MNWLKDPLLPMLLGTFGMICLIMCAEATNMIVDTDVTGTGDISGFPTIDDETETDDRNEVVDDNLIDDAIHQAIQDFEGKISKFSTHGYSKNDKA